MSEIILSEKARVKLDLSDIEKHIAKSIFPELRNSRNPLDHARIYHAAEVIKSFIEFILTPIEQILDERMETHAALKREARKALDALSQCAADNSDLRQQLRAARELTGEYAKPRIQELEQRIAALERELEESRGLHKAAQLSIQQGTAEINGQQIAIAGYERDISSLVTAAAGTAGKMRAAQAKLGAAMLTIRDRWPTPNPFIAAILADLEAAQKELPKE